MPDEDFQLSCQDAGLKEIWKQDAGLQGVGGRGEVGFVNGGKRELLIQSRRDGGMVEKWYGKWDLQTLF